MVDNTTLDIDDLLSRPTSVAREPVSSPTRELLHPSAKPFDSIESAQQPAYVNDQEISCHHELIKDRGRPVCSIGELSHILAEPETRYKGIESWLSDDPDSETGLAEMKTVFSRQNSRWWNFRNWQYFRRGIGEDSFSSFLEAERRTWEREGAQAMVSDPSFEETIRRQWLRMQESRRPSTNQAFSVYREIVKSRLAPYQFTRALQLNRNPRRQNAWTDWLEYLSYEREWYEVLTADAESLEERYHQAWKSLLEGPSCHLGRATVGSKTNATSNSKASGSSQARRFRPRNVDQVQELDAAWATLEATQKAIENFVRETSSYRRAQTATYYQRHRVNWVVEQARLMEPEISQESMTGKRNGESDMEVRMNGNQKRTRNDSNGKAIITPEPRLKRARLGNGGKSMSLNTQPAKHEIRRSDGLADLKDKVYGMRS